MKHLKSSLKDLQELFEHSVILKHIAEPLSSFDAEQLSTEVRRFMEKKDYDVVGVRQDGSVSGYARKSDLTGGVLGDHLLGFEPDDLLPVTTPLVKVLEAIHKSSRAFVLVLGEVGGIVTRGDFQKAPVRMWLFGLISLFEMQLLRIIRANYQDDSWKSLIKEKRLAEAEDLFAKRKLRNEAIDLLDCLQFCDKRDIVLKNEELRRSIGFESKTSGEEILKPLENLRNNLSHSQDIITEHWPVIVELVAKAEEILHKCEEVNLRP